MDSLQMERVLPQFPFLRELSESGLALLASNASLAQFDPGVMVARPGDDCEVIAFVAEGEVRVHKTSEAGRDLTLYRIYPGQTCILTALSMMARLSFPAQADTALATVAMIVPRAVFQRLFETEESWRRFVFLTMSQRLADLLTLIDEVVFTDLPARLAGALLTAQDGGVIRLTHEQIAGEIGSSREVVSRVLKTWERHGIVSLSRGQVLVCSLPELRRLAG